MVFLGRHQAREVGGQRVIQCEFCRLYAISITHEVNYRLVSCDESNIVLRVHEHNVKFVPVYEKTRSDILGTDVGHDRRKSSKVATWEHL